MLKENWRFISRLERLGDFLIVILSFFAAYYGRQSVIFWNNIFGLNLPFEGPELAPVKDYFIVLVVALLAYGVSLQVTGSYSSMRLSSAWRLLRISLLSSVVVFLSLAAVIFLLKLDLSRSFIVLFCVTANLAILAERYLVLEFLRFYRRKGMNFRNVIVCGVGEQALRFAHEVNLRPELGIIIRGFADLKDVSIDQAEVSREQFRDSLRKIDYNRQTRLIRGSKAFESALKDYAIDEVLFTDVVEVMPQVEAGILACAEQGIRTTIVADLFSLGMLKSGISYFGGMPLIHFQTPPGDRWELSLKRSIDFVLSAFLLLVFSPLFLLIALAIKISSSGPIIFSQRRVGLNGRLFQMYKFRSMRLDAEKELEQLKHANEMQGPIFKIREDPRITAVGRYLRRYSLDELPQLWNVLKGEMSLVGPRPPIPGEVSLYETKDRRRLSMRPGMTCTWQVSGRNEISDFDSWVKLDLEYIDNWSLTRDFELLLRTIPAVFWGTGAR